jgi:uncharacterized RDD family membrane protein YckC
MQNDHSSATKVEFKNRASAFIWAFAVVWLTLLIAFTAVLVRDGPPEGYS